MLERTDFSGLKLFKRGKVRDIYDLEDKLLIVSTDRISSFDIVLATPIPDKGKVLNKLSLFWFSFLKDIVDNHLTSANLEDLPESLKEHKRNLEDRFMIVKKCKVLPFECVVRGYLSGSAWKEYKTKTAVGGIRLAEGLLESSKLPEPIFTPATKSESGHDENVDFGYMKKIIGRELAEKVREISLSLYKKASLYAEGRGIIIADTKFEFGLDKDRLILIDEVLTPDSSRFWPKDEYREGGPQISFDKQYVRDYLNSLDWPKTYPAPDLPKEIVEKTQEKYLKALEIITGKTF